MIKWNIYLNNRVIDSVFFLSLSCGKDYIYDSLVNHDGFDSRIIVRRAR